MLFLGKKSDQGFDNLQGSALNNPLVWDGDRYQPSNRVSEMLTESSPGKRTCSSLQCTSTWIAPWRNRKRPIFEDQWGCSGRCVLNFVRAAVRRESADHTAETVAPHRHRVPLGLLMLSQEWITHSQLQYALDLQRTTGGRIGEILISECGIASEYITRALSLQWSCPVLSSRGFSAREMALVAPRTFVDKLGLVPVRVAGSKLLYLGFEDRLDASAALALELMSGLKVESGLMQAEEFRSIRTLLTENEGVELKEESWEETDAMAGRITAILEQKQPIASKLVRVQGNYWLRLWLEPAARGKFAMLPSSGEDMLDYLFTIER